MTQHIVTGAGAPLIAPPSLGAHYLDLTNSQEYIAFGTLTAEDWKLQEKGGAVAAGIDAHTGAADPHTQYVQKVEGKQLSTEDYTTAEKEKLAGLEGSHFKGLYVDLAALTAAVPAPVDGDYADVDAGAGSEVTRHVWDSSDAAWTPLLGQSAQLTAAQIKTEYEGNPDTNAFTDAEKAMLSSLSQGALSAAAPASQPVGIFAKTRRIYEFDVLSVSRVIPSDVVPGDLLLAFTSSTVAPLDPGNGWTLLADKTVGYYYSESLRIYAKTADELDAGSTLTMNAASGMHFGMQVVVLRGLGATPALATLDPASLATAIVDYQAGSVPQLPIAQITATADLQLAIAAVGSTRKSDVVTPPVGWTSITPESNDGESDGDPIANLFIAYKVLASGEVASGDFIGNGTSNATICSATVLFAPAA